WKKAPGEMSHPFQFYHFDGTFALMEKDDLDYGVIGNPTKASKEKGDALVEKVVEGYSAFIKDLLEKHPVGVNPLGFRNPLGFNGFNGGAYPTFDKDHDAKGRPLYYNK
ncbi:MAG: creatininase family protein, partial [Butyricicoccus pullicaecorum]|nr:creatininase family protein [Butyricicoccus pullicaecorum]